ncbi:MAG: hypothetical protein ACKO4T_03165 [Planctomycetaceae bacterium]
MKRPSISFSKDTVLGFLLNHFEKMIAAVVGLVVLMLAWNGLSALRTKAVPADRRPEALVRLSNETVQLIDAEPSPPADTMRRAGELAKSITPWLPPTLAVAPAPDVTPLSRPMTTDVVKRTNPRAFPLEDLRGITGIAVVKDPMAEQAAAAIMAADAAASSGETSAPEFREPPKRFEKLVPCVVLVGLVPVVKQREEFRKALGTPSDPSAAGGVQPLDAPRWGNFLVERALASEAEKPEAWRTVAAQFLAEQGAGKPLPERFLLGPNDLAVSTGEAGYVAALPPRVYEPWSLDTVHPWFLQPRHKWRLERSEQIAETPTRIGAAAFRRDFVDYAGHEIELVGMKFTGAAQRTPSPESVMIPVSAADDSDSFPVPNLAADPTGTAPTPPAALKPVFVMSAPWQRTLDMKTLGSCTLRVIPAVDGGAAVAQIIGIIPDAAGGQAGVELRDPRIQPVAGGMMGGGAPGGGEFSAPMMTGGGLDEGAEFRLFRFVDTTVDYGKTYRYRVTVELMNPNFGLDPRMLADAKVAQGETLQAVTPSSAAIAVSAPYSLAARASITAPPSQVAASGEAAAPAPKTTGPKQPQLSKNQVEVSFLGPTWQHMRGRRPDQGFDLFDYQMEHILPVEPGGTVLWKRTRRDKEKTDPRGKNEKRPDVLPLTRDPSWTLLSDADLGRDLIDFRGRQTSPTAAEGGKKDAPSTGILEPVELALLRPDGSLEVVTAADSQRLVETFEAGPGGVMAPGSEPGFFGTEGAPPMRERSVRER